MSLGNRTRINLDLNDDGIVVGPCTSCGEKAHDHDKKRVQHDNGTYSYDYYCPE